MHPQGLGVPQLLAVAAVATGIKLLLVPTYRSTDFEVHRNWLAITHSLPLSKWYTEATSQWTLDYPPFFAWFEFGLSHVAKYFDPAMLDVSNLEYASPATVLFQRLSVMVTDLVYITAAYALARHVARKRSAAAGAVLLVLLALNAGLLLVDHIHFQYNGVVVGLLLWSMYWLLEGQGWLASVAYTLVVHMKHLYVYCGPLYVAHLARGWCFNKGFAGGVARLLLLAVTVLGMSAASLGPFYQLGQLPQLLSRLFPFGRGLTHSYWAANFWALYSAADKGLAKFAPHMVRHSSGSDSTLDMAALEEGVTNSTNLSWVDSASGIVGVARFQVLPQVPPHISLALVGICLLPPTLSLLWRPHRARMPAALAYVLLAGFWFGYHVHEKAILPVLLLLAVPAVMHRSAAQDWLVLAAAGHYGLMPLLYEAQEYPIKMLLGVLYWLLAAHCLATIHSTSKSSGTSQQTPQLEGSGVSPSYMAMQHKADTQKGDAGHVMSEQPLNDAAGGMTSHNMGGSAQTYGAYTAGGQTARQSGAGAHAFGAYGAPAAPGSTNDRGPGGLPAGAAAAYQGGMHTGGAGQGPIAGQASAGGMRHRGASNAGAPPPPFHYGNSAASSFAAAPVAPPSFAAAHNPYGTAQPQTMPTNAFMNGAPPAQPWAPVASNTAQNIAAPGATSPKESTSSMVANRRESTAGDPRTEQQADAGDANSGSVPAAATAPGMFPAPRVFGGQQAATGYSLYSYAPTGAGSKARPARPTVQAATGPSNDLTTLPTSGATATATQNGAGVAQYAHTVPVPNPGANSSSHNTGAGGPTAVRYGGAPPLLNPGVQPGAVQPQPRPAGMPGATAPAMPPGAPPLPAVRPPAPGSQPNTWMPASLPHPSQPMHMSAPPPPPPPPGWQPQQGSAVPQKPQVHMNGMPPPAAYMAAQGAPPGIGKPPPPPAPPPAPLPPPPPPPPTHQMPYTQQPGSWDQGFSGYQATATDSSSIQPEVATMPSTTTSGPMLSTAMKTVAHKQPWSLSRLVGAGQLLPPLLALYVLGFVPLELYCSVLHSALLKGRLEFMPLLLTSVYCSLGVGYVWLRMILSYVFGLGYCGASTEAITYMSGLDL